jgi:hypothetical protein
MQDDALLAVNEEGEMVSEWLRRELQEPRVWQVPGGYQPRFAIRWTGEYYVRQEGAGIHRAETLEACAQEMEPMSLEVATAAQEEYLLRARAADAERR